MCSGAPAPTAPGRLLSGSQGRDGWSGGFWQGAEPLPALYGASHGDLGVLWVGGQGLPRPGECKAAALVETAGWVAGLGHPQVNVSVTFAAGPLHHRCDECAGDSAPAHFRRTRIDTSSAVPGWRSNAPTIPAGAVPGSSAHARKLAPWVILASQSSWENPASRSSVATGSW
jgi:hypothetical protein